MDPSASTAMDKEDKEDTVAMDMADMAMEGCRAWALLDKPLRNPLRSTSKV